MSEHESNELRERVEKLEAEVKALIEAVESLQAQLVRLNHRTWGMGLIGGRS
jgi:prefoldin subunit 5